MSPSLSSSQKSTINQLKNASGSSAETQFLTAYLANLKRSLSSNSADQKNSTHARSRGGKTRGSSSSR